MVFFRLCQVFFYLAWPFYFLWAEKSPVYRGGEESIRTYSWHEIHHLRQAVKPRPIYLFDAGLYAEKNKYALRGILFTVEAFDARQVFFVSDALHFQKAPMRRGKRGVWYYLYVPQPFEEGEIVRKIRYKYQIDGFFTPDKTHDERESDGGAGTVSVYYLTEEDIPFKSGVIVGKKKGHGREIVFRLKAFGAREVSLLASFNGWHGELDRLEEEREGIFKLRKHLPYGEHYYLYRVDGKTQMDPEAKEVRYHPVFGRVNVLRVSP
ncbi:MAG: glycogen-binding domain-containing protein [Leptospiraceae bacterium]|nr:glycogen-binding domain-containing protein [Leptospiraceae bacterium]MDW8305518.1 glycogen-binding domain-containing protein [Leptospiraceae bacterium]